MSKRRVSFTISEDLYAFMCEQARRTGRGLSSYIRLCIKSREPGRWMDVLSKPRAPRSKGFGWVYILHMYANGQHYHKIGHTKHRRSRYDAINIASPLQVDIVAEVPVDDRLGVEWAMHHELASRRVTGEWFDLGDRGGSGSLLPFAVGKLESYRCEPEPEETRDE